MNDYYIIFFLALSGFVLVLVKVMRWVKTQDARAMALEKPLALLRERRARELGWRYDPTHDGDIRYRFAGNTVQGLAWELRYDSDASSSSSVPKLIWEIKSLRVPQTSFEISQGKGFELMQGSGAQKAASVAASIAWALGSAAAQDVITFYKEAKVQPLGSASFRGRWKVLARSTADAARLLDAETEEMMMKWPITVERQFDPFTSVKVIRGPKGLQIECIYDSTDMLLLEHIVRLGEAISARVTFPNR